VKGVEGPPGEPEAMPDGLESDTYRMILGTGDGRECVRELQRGMKRGMKRGDAEWGACTFRILLWSLRIRDPPCLTIDPSEIDRGFRGCSYRCSTSPHWKLTSNTMIPCPDSEKPHRKMSIPMLTPPDSVPLSPSSSKFPSSPSPVPSSINKSYINSLLSLTDALTSSISTLSFPPLVAAARMAIISMMSHSITYGRLRVLTANSGIYVFPSDEKRKELGLSEAGEAQTVDIRVIRDTFWLKLVTLGDLGFAEAYMAGDCEVSDLVQVFKVSQTLKRYDIMKLTLPSDLHPIEPKTRSQKNSLRRLHHPLSNLLPDHIPHQLALRKHPLQLHLQHPSPLRPFQRHVPELPQCRYDV